MSHAFIQVTESQSHFSKLTQFVMKFSAPNGSCRCGKIQRLPGNRIVNLFSQRRTVIEKDAIKLVFSVGLLQMFATHPMQICGYFFGALFPG